MKQDNSRQADLFASYLAGFFDGEGNVGSGLNGGPSGTPWLRLLFSQSDLQMLIDLKEDIETHFDIETGKIEEHKGYNKLSTKPTYSLGYQGSKACKLAKIMLPYARVKGEHLEWIEFTWENRMNVDGKTINKEFFEKQHLNRPGRRAAATTKREDTQDE